MTCDSKTSFRSRFMGSALALVALAPSAMATEGHYVDFGGGWVSRSGSANSGALTSAFTTGAGTTIPAGTSLPAGTDLGWNTNFKSGYALRSAIGYGYGNGFRSELEFAWRQNKVSSHDSVAVGGGVIDSEDAGVLITGSGNLGASVGAIVADGQGKSSSWAFMANGYYDIDTGTSVTPYLGAGLGYASTKVRFNPSGVGIADDSDGSFAWQLIGGLGYQLSDTIELYADYRYFDGGTATVALDLLPGDLSVENKSHNIFVGFRFRFN